MTEELKELAVRLLIVCVAVTWLVIVWRLHRDPAMPNFSVRNLFATREGYPDRVAIEEIGCWVVMTAVVLIAALRNSLSLVELCGIYVGVFTLRGAHTAYLRAKNPLQPGTISRTHESSIDTQVVTGPKKPGGHDDDFKR